METTPTSSTASQPGSAKWIAAKVRTSLSHYFRPELSEELDEAQLSEWVRLLMPFSRDVITHAFDRFGADNGKFRPTPYQIVGLCDARKAHQERMKELASLPPALPKPKDEPRTPVTAEQAKRIMEEAGFDPERSNLVKRFPMATSMNEARAKFEAGESRELPPEAYMTPAEMRERGLA